jgi:2-dehydropantoate 2-reductase
MWLGTTDEVSAALFPDPHSRPTYYAGSCYAGIYSKPPFGFVYAGLGALTLGQVDSLDDAVPARGTDNILLQSLSAARPTLGTELVIPMQLRVAQLSKLAVNSTINPFSVVFNCKNGRVFESETQREALNQVLLHETGPILRALLPAGLPTHLRDKFQHDKLVELVLQVAKDTADNFSSMLQDVRAGKQTEVDYINGYLVRKAEDHGIETPQNAGLVEFVKQASRNKGLFKPHLFSFPDGELNPVCAQLRRFWSFRQATGSGKSSDRTRNKPDRQGGQEGVVETHDPDRTRQ